MTLYVGGASSSTDDFCTEFWFKEVRVLLGFGCGSSEVSGLGLIWLRSSSGRLWSELVDTHVWISVFYICLCMMSLVGCTLRDST